MCSTVAEIRKGSIDQERLALGLEVFGEIMQDTEEREFQSEREDVK